MTEYIDTREGWHEVPYGTRPSEPGWVMECLPDGTERYWVRKAPLPTEPGYYLAYDGSVYRLADDDYDGLIWDDTFGNPQYEEDIKRTLPLQRLEPRAETAKAVIDRVLNGNGILSTRLDAIAREFGVNHD